MFIHFETVWPTLLVNYAEFDLDTYIRDRLCTELLKARLLSPQGYLLTCRLQ